MNYQDYLLLSREDKLSMLMDLFHHPATTPEHMEAIQREYHKVLNSGPELTIYLKTDLA